MFCCRCLLWKLLWVHPNFSIFLGSIFFRSTFLTLSRALQVSGWMCESVAECFASCVAVALLLAAVSRCALTPRRPTRRRRSPRRLSTATAPERQRCSVEEGTRQIRRSDWRSNTWHHAASESNDHARQRSPHESGGFRCDGSKAWRTITELSRSTPSQQSAIAQPLTHSLTRRCCLCFTRTDSHFQSITRTRTHPISSNRTASTGRIATRQCG